MNQFLKQNMELFTGVMRLQKQLKTHFIFGNTSCDLDSCASAISLAWIKQQSQENSSSLYIPVMNIHRSRFDIRTEVNYLLKELNVLPENLLFRNEIDFETLSKSGNFQLSLVDHHVFVSTDEFLDDYVVEIIDHRPKGRPIPNHISKINFATVGSCSTLIAEMLKKSSITEIPLSIKKLLSGAILLDTDNLSQKTGKTTTRDIDMVDWLYPKKVDQKDLFEKLERSKFSVDHLSTFDVLLKDLKLVEGPSSRIVFSSIHLSSKRFLNRTDIEQSIVQCLNDYDSSSWIGVFPTTHVEGMDFKPLLLWSPDKCVREKFAEKLLLDNDLAIQTLEEKVTSNNFIWLKMTNVKRTRKQILPVVKSFVNEL